MEKQGGFARSPVHRRRVMQKSSSTTCWGIVAGGTCIAVLCAATMPAQAGGQRSADRDWWSLQPLGSVAVPSIDGSQRPQNPIDHFILHRLKKEGLAPSPAADRRTLIRRLSFDLVGLPPTPHEVEAFVNDRAPGAYERLVDRLLDSPHYGERWARHWLDTVPY